MRRGIDSCPGILPWTAWKIAAPWILSLIGAFRAPFCDQVHPAQGG
jgi:hypothetical protein